MSLINKTALITGAGLGIAKRLAGQGATVLINDLTSAKAEAAAQKVTEGGKAVADLYADDRCAAFFGGYRTVGTLNYSIFKSYGPYSRRPDDWPHDHAGRFPKAQCWR